MPLDLETVDSSLLDVVDNVLNHGVVLHGDLTLGLANIDLIYARLALMLAAVDKVDTASGQPSAAARRKLKFRAGASAKAGAPPGRSSTSEVRRQREVGRRR